MTTKIDFAVLHTGPPGNQKIMLALQARAGRSPVTLTDVLPQITWRCADGVEETLRLDGEIGYANHHALVEEIDANKVLVAEFSDLQELAGEPARVWLLGWPDVEVERERLEL